MNYLLEKTHERLRGGINVLPMLKEVATQWDDFFIDTGRQDTIECQKETMSINLVSADVTTKENRHTNATVETETYSRYPKVKEFMHWFEETYGGLIFRIAIVHLPADGVVHPHIDEGTYYQDKDRFPEGPWCKEKDWVMFARYAGSRIKIEGGEMRLLNDDEVLATIESPEDILHEF